MGHREKMKAETNTTRHPMDEASEVLSSPLPCEEV